MVQGIDKESLFTPGIVPAFDHRPQIRRIQEHQVESFVADAGMVVAAETHPVQPVNRFLCSVTVEFDAVGSAIVILCQRL